MILTLRILPDQKGALKSISISSEQDIKLSSLYFVADLSSSPISFLSKRTSVDESAQLAFGPKHVFPEVFQKHLCIQHRQVLDLYQRIDSQNPIIFHRPTVGGINVSFPFCAKLLRNISVPATYVPFLGFRHPTDNLSLTKVVKLTANGNPIGV